MHDEVRYAVRYRRETGSPNTLYTTYEQAITECDKRNAEWWRHWVYILGFVWFVVNGFHQKWYVETFVEIVYDQVDIDNAYED